MLKNGIILGALSFLSVQAMAVNPSVDLECHFTEPFYSTTLNLQTGRLTQSEPHWDGDVSDTITTVLHENLEVQLVPGTRALNISATNPNNGEMVMSGIFNFLGSDGMSDYNHPVDITHHNVYADGSSLRGGCQFSGVAPYDTYTHEGTWLEQFSINSGDAIALCFNRAVSEWTLNESTYAPNNTVFYVLYSGDEVPGEPGQVSSNFASAENEYLHNLLQNTRTPPQDGYELYQRKQAMWDYCTQYSEFLQNRILN